MGAVVQKYRHELKFVVSTAEVALLKSRLARLMEPDPHAGPDGGYQVRSLYFDDYHNRCFHENENGVEPREKFRIRIYDHGADRIVLECKRKEHGLTGKTACLLTQEQAWALIRGQTLPLGQMHPLLRRFDLEMRTRGLRPAAIVEYRRFPFVCQRGNVRITFDTRISSCSDFAGFFSETLPKRPVMPLGQQLMEVKLDEYLPGDIRRALDLGRLQQTACSKYCLCRKFPLF